MKTFLKAEGNLLHQIQAPSTKMSANALSNRSQKNQSLEATYLGDGRILPRRPAATNRSEEKAGVRHSNHAPREDFYLKDLRAVRPTLVDVQVAEMDMT